MATLTEYTTETRALLNDPNAQFYTQANVTRWINQGRKRVAGDAQCVRAMPRTSGGVLSIAVTAGGSGYSVAPTVSITAPDAYGVGFVNATATATVLAGAVTAVTVTLAGTGYVNTPTVSFSGGGGTGAAATATLQSRMTTMANQEVYDFSTANAILTSQNPAIASVLGVQTVAVSWGATFPVMRVIPFSAMQAYLRSVNLMAQNFPAVAAQYGQGLSGSIYLYPIPAQLSEMRWDCYCLPVDLTSDATPDAIPYPWTECVPFLACYYAYMNAQRRDDANMMLKEYYRLAANGRTRATPAIVPDFYGAMY